MGRLGDPLTGKLGRMPRIHRVDPAAPGLSRRRRGRGFGYEDARGRAVDDDEVLARIAGLAIPPAWEDVWICRDALGHLQAAGTDTAGRRQYLYHPAWRERQDTRKFQRIEAFARALPEIRRTVEQDLDAYREGGRWRDVRSSDITSYLKDELGQEHSAKDFRTWSATVLAAVDLSSAEAAAQPPASRKRQVTATVKWVAECMGNTPAVCRASYIDPRVFDRYREGITIEQAIARIGKPADTDHLRSAVEEAVLDLLAGARRAAVAA